MKFVIPEKEEYKITLIGCGGTGGYLAQSLARIASDFDFPINLTFIDGDTVEEKNIGRQNFFPFEIGNNKAQVLAERYSLALATEIRYIDSYIDDSPSNDILSTLFTSDIIISAVDSAKARKNIHKTIKTIKDKVNNNIGFYNPSFFTENKPGLMVWIDAGNGQNSGQIILGNTFDMNLLNKQVKKNGTINFIPYPSIQEPDLINPKKEKESENNPNLSCAERLALKEQSLTINSIMASAVASIINNLLNQKGVLAHKIIISEEIPAMYPVMIESLFTKG